MKKHGFFKGLLTWVLVLSMILTSTVLLTVAADEGDSSAVAGDASGNGIVNLLDLLILRQYFANFDYNAGEEPFIEGGDISGDGKVSLNDIVEMRRYLVDLDFGVTGGADNITAVLVRI